MKKLVYSVLITLLFLGFSINGALAKVTEYNVVPKEATIEVGQEVQFRIDYKTDDGTVCQLSFFQRKESDKENFTLTEDGLVKGLKPGDFEFGATCYDYDHGIAYGLSGYVHIVDTGGKGVSITTGKDEYTYYVHKWQLGTNRILKEHMNINVSPEQFKPNYSIQDESILQIASPGVFTLKNFGSTNLTISAGTQSKTVKVNVLDKDKENYSTFESSFNTIPAPTETTEFIPDRCNTGTNGYTYNWYKVICSYLEPTTNGFMRVCGNNHGNNKVVVEYYDNEFKPITQKTIDWELPIFGGFYNGEDNFFMVFGQNNPNEDDNQEVIRVVKYDKNWNRIAQTSFYGEHMTVPFDAGTLRMAEYKDKLYILTCKEGYKSSDGINHQSSCNYCIDVPTMEGSHGNLGDCSHSFNQFIIIDKNDVITLEHGDANPRAANMFHNSSFADGNGINFTGVRGNQLISYFGERGDNVTNATVGGLEASNDYYLTVGCSTTQTSMDGSGKNIYITATSKAEMGTTQDHHFRWLTQEDFNGSNPHLVKFDNNNFLVIWNKTLSPTNQQGYYVFVDGAGNPKSEVKTFDGEISDCKPIVKDGKAYWIVNNSSYTAYSMDGAGNISKTPLGGNLSQIYRLYNTKSGEHLFTSDYNEYVTLGNGDWNQEGVAWTAPISGTPVFRLYNPALADHLYTTDQNEVSILTSQRGWQADNNGQPLFYSDGSVPVYRLYNSISYRHLLTRDENEYNVLPSFNWQQEGISLNAIS